MDAVQESPSSVAMPKWLIPHVTFFRESGCMESQSGAELLETWIAHEVRNAASTYTDVRTASHLLEFGL